MQGRFGSCLLQTQLEAFLGCSLGGSTCPYHQLKKQLLSLEKPQEAPRLLILTRSFSFEVSTRRSPNDGDTNMWQRHW